MKQKEPSVKTAEFKTAKKLSPGGTTVRGLMALEQNNFKYAVIKAVTDATARAEELGRKS